MNSHAAKPFTVPLCQKGCLGRAGRPCPAIRLVREGHRPGHQPGTTHSLSRQHSQAGESEPSRDHYRGRGGGL